MAEGVTLHPSSWWGLHHRPNVSTLVPLAIPGRVSTCLKSNTLRHEWVGCISPSLEGYNMPTSLLMSDRSGLLQERRLEEWFSAITCVPLEIIAELGTPDFDAAGCHVAGFAHLFAHYFRASLCSIPLPPYFCITSWKFSRVLDLRVRFPRFLLSIP